jgi:hypothetical protein
MSVFIELMARPNFFGGTGALNAPREFGRANHRLMHFVTRHTGITVAELLDIFPITKQSLIRVLND